MLTMEIFYLQVLSFSHPPYTQGDIKQELGLNQGPLASQATSISTTLLLRSTWSVGHKQF